MITDLYTGEISGVTNFRLDVARINDWTRLVAVIAERHGRLDILVNNADIQGSLADVVNEELEDWNAVLSVNLTGVYFGKKTAIPLMRAAGGGSIVNISSTMGIIATPVAAAYTAAKGAVRSLTKQAALAYATDQIRVNSVHPGSFDTPMVAGQPKEITDMVVPRTPLGRLGRPAELAAAILFLASDGGYMAQ